MSAVVEDVPGGGDDGGGELQPPWWLRASNRLITAYVLRQRRVDPAPFPAVELGADRLDDGPVEGWWLPARTGTARAVVVVAHGFGARAATMASSAEALAAAGAHVLVHDHQSLPRLGRGGARPETPDVALTAAALAAVRLAPGLPLRLLGHSFGGGAALGTAASLPAVDRVATLAAVADPARTSLSVIPAWLNRRALAVIRQRGGPDLGDRIGVRAMRRRPDLRVLAVHAEDDGVVPVVNALRLAEAGARLLLLPAGGHDPRALFAAARDDLVEFLLSATADDPAAAARR